MSQRKTAEEILTDEKPYTYKGNYLYSGSSVLSVMKKFAKQEVEARDALIKELVSDLGIIKKQLEIKLDSNRTSYTEDGIYLIISNTLTKAQSFNHE